MKTSSLLPLHLLALLVTLLTVHFASAQTNGAWINASSNSAWGTPANWAGGIIADGADAIADFSTLDITAARTVNLGSNRTVGSLLFGDTTGSHNWALANGAGGPWSLTLATGSGSPVIQVNNQTATVSALIAGNQGLTKTGAGALTLSNAANSLTGGINLSAGVLNFASGSLGSNLVAITANATLGWSAGNTQDISGQLKIEDGTTAVLATGANSVALGSAIQTGSNGTASVTKTGAGTLTFTAANSYTGSTRISGGRIVLAGGDQRLVSTSSLVLGQNASSGVLQLGDSTAPSEQTFASIVTSGSGTANAIVGGNAANSRLILNNSAAVVFAGQIGGAGASENQLALTKQGAGALTLSHPNNSFTGEVNIVGGNVIITNASALGTGAKTVTISGTVNAPTLRLDGSSADLSLPADYSLVTSNDNVNNPALLSTGGNNSIAGTIALTTGGFGTGNTRIKVTGGSLTLSGSIAPAATATGPVTVILDSAIGTTGSTTGLLSDNGSIVLNVTKASAGVWSLSGSNSYTGTTTISAGTLRIDSIAALGSGTSALLIGSSTAGSLEYVGTNAATLSRGISVNGNGGATIANTGGTTLTLTGPQARSSRALTYSDGSFVVSGRITGTSTTNPLTIHNATVRLTHNNNSYVSPTVVQNNATLIVANTSAASSATGTGSVTIDATSTLTGTGFINAGADNFIWVKGALVVGDPLLSTAASLDLTTSGTGAIEMASTSVLSLDLFNGAGLGNNTSNASAADLLRLFGSVILQPGATLRLGNPNQLTAWADCDTFKLIDWTSLSTSGTFQVDASALDLPSGLQIDTSQLYTLGTIAITVPEPSRAIILGLGLMSIAWRRRRVKSYLISRI